MILFISYLWSRTLSTDEVLELSEGEDCEVACFSDEGLSVPEGDEKELCGAEGLDRKKEGGTLLKEEDKLGHSGMMGLIKVLD